MVHNEYKMDKSTIEDIKAHIDTLSKSYVPEWKFDEDNPDIGSVIALLYANQLYDNTGRYNRMLEKYHLELINLLDISPLPAHPSGATVIMELVPDSVQGVPVSKGTKLLAETAEDNIVFETAHSVYVTGSNINTVLMTRGSDGKVIPVSGSFEEKDYAGEVVENLPQSNDELKDFNLFDFSGKGLEKQAILLYHDSIFDNQHELIDCRIKGNPDFVRRLANGEFRILYYTSEGFKPVEQCNVVGEHIFFSKADKSKQITIKNKEYSLIVVEAKEPQRETIKVDAIEFSSSGSPVEAEYVGNGTTDFDVNSFNMFGDTLAVFAECYIGMDTYFSKKDSKITISFDMSFVEKYIGAVREPEKEDLRLIKRKKRFRQEETVAYTYAQEISVEYFNGIGWKRIKFNKEYTNIFEQAQAGNVELTFVCPNDWVESSSGGYHGRMLRIQLLKADNCYYQPCIHTYPKISNLNIAYTYDDNYKKPVFGTGLFGTQKRDFTSDIIENKSFTVFSRGNYTDTALYIGFDKVFDNGPISLWWKLGNNAKDMNKKLRYYYSTNSEFKEMKMVDYTANLTKTGTMMFLPEADMGMLEIENRKLCWIKIVEENYEDNQICTHVEKLAVNAVEVYNIETLEEEEFYLDNVTANASFPLRADRILSADVWVNEKNELTRQEMFNLMNTMPDKVRVNFDYMGEIEEFFVKWEECGNFISSAPDSRHYILDRIQNRIIFGDGIHVKIPRNLQGTSFSVQVKCCNGRIGNVPANSITQTTSNVMFINDIYNPEPAYGGSDMEMLEKALQRGANLLSSGGRFVTEQDYLTEIKSYSDVIENVSIICNVDRYGEYKEDMMYIVLLMKDFMDSSASFYRIQGNLKQHLLERCELSILPERLMIEEPIFVELNVSVWADILHIEDNFDIQTSVQKSLNEYLNPISSTGKKGWDIGVLPCKSQIIMKLNAVKSKAIINHIMVTAKYSDKNGVHEVDLEDLKVSPFMVVRNGIHKIYLSQKVDN